MKVILAQPRGFCAGVIRAIDTVERALEQFDEPVYVRHQIVHNEHVVQGLKEKGAIFVEELDEVPAHAVTIFSAHGVSKDVERDARERRLQVLDATCPLVAKVHAQGRRYAAAGYQLILIGELGHPEVIGTTGQIPTPVTLIQTVEQVENLPFPVDAPLAYLTQTTLSLDDTRAVVDALRLRYPKIVGPQTRDICYAVQNRQHALRDLTQCSDVVLVVGSSKSANAVTLLTLAKNSGLPAYLIANSGDLRAGWFTSNATVGVTAGASTPESSIQDVLQGLAQIYPVQVETLPGIEERVEFQLPLGLIARQPSAQTKQ